MGDTWSERGDREPSLLMARKRFELQVGICGLNWKRPSASRMKDPHYFDDLMVEFHDSETVEKRSRDFTGRLTIISSTIALSCCRAKVRRQIGDRHS